MIDINHVRDILLDFPYISDIRCQEGKHDKDIFASGIKCLFLLEEYTIPIFIGIPEAWDRELVAIYLEDYAALPFMPHIEKNGKICLFDLEGVLIDFDFEGLLGQCIQRAYDILRQGLFENTESELVREFSSYWNYQKNVRSMRFAVPMDHVTQIIKYCDPASAMKQRKNESQISFMKRKHSSFLFGAGEANYFDVWKVTGTQKNGIYFFVKPTSYILPPDPRKDLDVAFLNELLAHVSLDSLPTLKKLMGKPLLMVFEILEPGNEVACIGMKATGVNINTEGSHLFASIQDKNYIISAISIIRIDKAYLTQRTEHTYSGRQRNILLIGCGSIGGYLCSELVKSGYEKLTLVDGDILSAENVYRHFLGFEYVGEYKAEGLRRYCKNSFPFSNIKTVDSSIEELVEEGSIDISDYDVIISATGNHNVNRWINRYTQREKIYVPCVYLWNEPLDLGCHLSVIQYGKEGCYECFFARDAETNELYDKTAYSRPGQMITKSSRGCAGTFVPYSSNVSLRVVSLCLEWLQRVFTGRCDNNILCSVKGDAYYFQKEGYSCSQIYLKQKESELTIYGSAFKNDSCEICGEV